MFKINNKDIRTTPFVIIVNFEYISHLVLLFLLLTLNMQIPARLAFTCTKSTIETLEEGVESAQS